MTFLRRLLAFLVRDLRSETSYRLYFVMQLGGLAWTLVLFYFVATLVGRDAPSLERYGGDWFAYVVLGYAPLEFLRVGVVGFSSRIREAQSFGTLEALLVTPVGIPTIVFGSVAYAYAWAGFRATVFLGIGWWALGAPADANLPAVALFLALSIVAFGAVGVLSASFVMVFKKGDPISMLVLATTTLFSGLLFPTELLGTLEKVSWILPLTWSMEGIRRAVVHGASLAELWLQAVVLLGFCVVLVPLAAWCFRVAVDRARRDGTLSHY